MKKTIAIIGAGQLGSRHLQSLSALDKDLFEIVVFDTQMSSLEVAQQRYLEVTNEQRPSILVSADFDSLPKEMFCVIVATGSMVRKVVVENLLKHAHVEYLILEKFLFTKMADYESVEKLLNQTTVKTFVNTPRRTFDFYRGLGEKIAKPFHMEVTGSQWGLGCNAIHFLDLFYYLNQRASIEIFSNMDKEVIPSKREGYIEFTGSFLMKDQQNNSCVISSFKEGNQPIVVTITDSNGKWIIHEGLGYLNYFSAEDSTFTYKKEAIRAPFQSESTSKIIQDLADTGDCKITPFFDSAYLHQQLLKEYIHHYSQFLNKNIDSCPIT